MTEKLVIKNATLIDGRGGEPLKNAALVIDGKRIESVGLEAAMAFSSHD